MVHSGDPLATFPLAATRDSVDTKVANRSTKGHKRRRLGQHRDLTDDLTALDCYDEATSSFRPHNVEEVSKLLTIAHKHQFSISVLNTKGTGTHGNAVGGDVIVELTAEHFKQIAVNEAEKTVKVGGGVTSRMVDQVLSESDLFTPLVGYTVGLGAFLSGGFGFASRLHGLTVDNILEVDCVLADGTVVKTTPQAHADLHWALLGCGTSFGVVTSLTLKCFPLRRSSSSNIIFPFERDTGADLLRHWRDCLEDAPNELYSNFVIAAGPDAPAGAVAILQICHLDEEDAAQEFYERMASFSGVKYHLRDNGEISYIRQQELVEAVLKGAAADAQSQPAESQVKYLLSGNVLTDLDDDEIIEETCRRFHDNAPTGSIWCFELYGGIMSSVKDSCIPDTHRAARFHAASIFRVRADLPEAEMRDSAGRDWVRDTISRASPGGPLPSFFPTSPSDSREAKYYHDVIRGTYGHQNWQKLKKIKREYDPMNQFSHGFDIGMLGLEEELVDGV